MSAEMTTAAGTYDLIGVGFGPSNLALAIALEERGARLATRFLEARPGFAWHPDMMLEGSDMQVSFLKDLVTLRDPRSPFSFLCYLQARGRLERFINRKTFFPSRHEFNDYLAWVAGELGDVCDYDQRVREIAPVARADGRVTALVVTAEDAEGRPRRRITRDLVLAVGGQPHRPAVFDPVAQHPGLVHSSAYLGRVRAWLAARARPARIAVIGGGQSAAEIFADLAAHPAAPEVELVLRGRALRPSDDTPFVNEIFAAAETDRMFARSPDARAGVLRDYAATNYAVVDGDLIAQIYTQLYEQEVVGGTRLALRRGQAVTGVEPVGEGLRLALADAETGAVSLRDYDLVILATGFRRSLSDTVLQGLAPWLAGQAPGRDYRLPTVEGFAPRLFVQGYSEPTHGLSDTLLSVLALRADEIAGALTGRPGAPRAAARPDAVAAE